MRMFCSNCESGERTVLCVATNCETAGIHAAIRGPTEHLFEHNSQIIGQIQANLAACKVNIAHKQLQLNYTSQLLEQMKKKVSTHLLNLGAYLALECSAEKTIPKAEVWAIINIHSVVSLCG
jgi:hypothetical protein